MISNMKITLMLDVSEMISMIFNHLILLSGCLTLNLDELNEHSRNQNWIGYQNMKFTQKTLKHPTISNSKLQVLHLIRGCAFGILNTFI